MCCNVKQLKNYTTEQVETLFESNENNVIGVKLYAIIQLMRGTVLANLKNFIVLRTNKSATGQIVLMLKALMYCKLSPVADAKLLSQRRRRAAMLLIRTMFLRAHTPPVAKPLSWATLFLFYNSFSNNHSNTFLRFSVICSTLKHFPLSVHFQHKL